MSWLLSPARRASQRDEGFSVIEVMIAMAVFALVGTFMSQTLAGGMRGVLGGKRREVATQEGNRILEIARSLTYDAVGLAQSDTTLATDPAIETHGGKQSYRSATTWEPLFWASNPSGHPFNPHVLAVTRGSTKLTRYVYVTGVDSNSDGTIDLKRVLVRVAWDDSGSGGVANEIRAQTLISKSSLVPTGGGTPLTAKTASTGGSITVKPSTLLGLSAPLAVTLPTSKGSSTFRAVSTTNCTTKSAAVNVLDVVDMPGYSVTVTADDDSRTATPVAPPNQSSTGVLSIPAGPAGSLLGNVITSPVACEANLNALGHELGTGSAAGTVAAQTNITALSGLLNWALTLASVQTLPVTQQIDHEIVAGKRESFAQTSGGVGLVNVLKIPGVIPDGLVRVDGITYGASVRAAEGTPSVAPTITSPTFTVRIFDTGSKLGAACSTGLSLGPGITASRSNPYCVFTVNPAAAGFTGVSIPISLTAFTQVLGLNVVNLSFTTQVDILPSAKSPPAGVIGANGEYRWSGEYNPIAVSASLDASILGVPIIDADVDLNLGSVLAESCAGATCS